MQALIYDVHPVRWTFCKVAGRVVPAIYWSRCSNLRLTEVAVPDLPGAEWVRVKTVLGGVCGTDLTAIFQRQHPASILQAFSSFPAMLGHENVGVIEKTGSQVAKFRPGDRVVVEPSLSCTPRGIHPVCPSCAAGRFTLCNQFRDGSLPPGLMIGWNDFTGGSWSPYFVAHESQLYRVPEGISDEWAVLTDPVAGGLHGVLRRPPREGETVLILGGGVLGMAVTACLRALGYRNDLVGLVRHARQAEQLKRYGASECVISSRGEGQAGRYGKIARMIGGKVLPTRFGHQAFIGGFDLVYDCVGSGQSLTDALKFARSGGTVALVGTSQISIVDTAPLWFNEVDVVGANGRAIETYEGRRCHTYEIVFGLMEQGKLNVDGWLTHVFRLDEYRKAFATAYDRGRSGAVKVAFDPSRC